MDEQFPDFTNKSVVFYITTPVNAPDWFSEGLVLESPSFQKQNNRIFVTGQTPQETENETKSDWSANREAGIAWDSVFYYVVLPLNEYQEARIKHINDNSEVPIEGNKEVLNVKNSSQKNLLSFSLVLIGLLIPIALLVAIIIWIVKML